MVEFVLDFSKGKNADHLNIMAVNINVRPIANTIILQDILGGDDFLLYFIVSGIFWFNLDKGENQISNTFILFWWSNFKIEINCNAPSRIARGLL